MPYIDKHLIEGEEVIYEGQISMWSLANWLLCGLGGVALVFLPSRFVLIPFLAGVGCLIWAVIQFASTELAVTNKRVIAKYGWISRRTVEISLDRVEGVEVQQAIHQRVLNYGNIFVSGTGSHKAKIINVAEPMSFRQAFLAALDAHQGLATESTAPRT